MSSIKELHAKKVEAIFKEMGNTIYKIEDKETFDYLYTYYTEFLPTKDQNINYDVYNKIVLNALNGDPDYEAALGEVFMYGRGVNIDANEALRWIISSASLSSMYGETLLGLCYYNGFGLEQNSLLAIKWLSDAASKNYGDAKYYLGSIYTFGEEKYLNYELGFKLLLDSVDLGNEDAVCKVAICLLEGFGCKQSLFKAYKMIELGKNKHYPEASKIYDNAFYDFSDYSEEEINAIDINVFLMERGQYF